MPFCHFVQRLTLCSVYESVHTEADLGATLPQRAHPDTHFTVHVQARCDSQANLLHWKLISKAAQLAQA